MGLLLTSSTPTVLPYLRPRGDSYCSGEDGGVMSSLWDGALLSRVGRELKSRLTTPASCFLRFAFGAAGAKSELKGNKTHNDRQNAARTKDGGELTGGQSVQRELHVSSVAFWASILTSPQVGRFL